MKDALLLGGVAVGAYLLFNYFRNQETALLSTVTTVNTTTASSTVNYPPGYITPTLKARMLSVAQTQQPYASYYVSGAGLMSWYGWAQIYTALTQLNPAGAPEDEHTPGDAYTALRSLDQFASIINNGIAPALNIASLSGLGMIAIPTARVNYANSHLPHHLELFNAMVR